MSEGKVKTGEILLHIGRHKSGTSNLQHFLHSNRRVLESKGFYYPDTLIRNVAHHELADRIDRRRVGEVGIDNVRKDIDVVSFVSSVEKLLEHGNVIVSSEGLSNVDPTLLKHFTGVLPLRVVVYLREQKSYLLSAYAQYIQNNPGAESLEQYERNRFRADYQRFLDDWSNAYGCDSLIVRVFDRSQLYGGDIVKDFCRYALNIDIDSEPGYVVEDVDKNKSLPPKLVAFKRRANETGVLKSLERKTVYKTLMKMAFLPEYAGKAVIPDNLLSRLMKQYQSSNEYVCKHYLGDGLRLNISTDGTGVPEEVSSQEFDRILNHFHQFLEASRDSRSSRHI